MKISDLHDLLESDYKLQNRALGREPLYHFKHLLRKMDGLEAAAITPIVIERYKVERLEEKAARSTVNNELAQLRRSMNLAVELELLPRAPKVRLLTVDNVREGFLHPDEFTRIIKTLEVLDRVVSGIVQWLYLLGWRREEVVGLKWTEVDIRSGTVQLPAGRTKTRKIRTIRVGERLHALLLERWAVRQGEAVFHREGKPVRCFRGAWKHAVTALGRPDLVPHDCRRSFARNALQARVPHKVIMEIGGWRTMSVFLRYAICDEAVISEALDQVNEYVLEKGNLAP